MGEVVSVNVNQSGVREDVWQARPGGDGSPADRDAGGLAGWRCGSRGLLRAGYGARQAVSCRSSWWWAATARSLVMAVVFALSFIWIQLIAQGHGLVVCLLGASTSRA